MKDKTNKVEKVIIRCLYCDTPYLFDSNSYEAKGEFNVFCFDAPCEDRYIENNAAG